MDLCTPNIIVQEYLGGISGAQLVKLQEQGVEPFMYVKENLVLTWINSLITLGKEYVYGMFTYQAYKEILTQVMLNS